MRIKPYDKNHYKMNQKLTIGTLLGLMAVLVSFTAPKNIDIFNNTQKNNVNPNTKKFIDYLKNGKELSTFF